MYDYYLFPLPRASKWNRPVFDHSEVIIDLYAVFTTKFKILYVLKGLCSSRAIPNARVYH